MPMLRLCAAVARTLYGELPPDKLLQALTFSLLLCFVVGIYWMMRSLKDSVFATIVGLEHQPQAKMLSLVVVTVVLFVYNKVVDLVPRHHLFSIVCGTYAAIFVGTSACLLSPTIGLYGPDGQALPASPDRWLGWVHYFAIESYGSLAVSLFWQYTNSQVNLADAKAQYVQRGPATALLRHGPAPCEPPDQLWEPTEPMGAHPWQVRDHRRGRPGGRHHRLLARCRLAPLRCAAALLRWRHAHARAAADCGLPPQTIRRGGATARQRRVHAAHRRRGRRRPRQRCRQRQ